MDHILYTFYLHLGQVFHIHTLLPIFTNLRNSTRKNIRDLSDVHRTFSRQTNNAKSQLTRLLSDSLPADL
jgi:hypothetical protein